MRKLRSILIVVYSPVFVREASGMFFLLAGIVGAIGCVNAANVGSDAALTVDVAGYLAVSVLFGWGAFKMRRGSRLALQLALGWYLLDSFITLFLLNSGHSWYANLVFDALLVRAFARAYQTVHPAASGPAEA